MDKPDKQTILNTLPHFTGTENYHRHLGNTLLTDGALYVAESCGAFWLMDIIYSVQRMNVLRWEEMQVCRLQKTGETQARVTITNGNSVLLYVQDIEYTDFPLEEITLWACSQEYHRVIMLPSEY